MSISKMKSFIKKNKLLIIGLFIILLIGRMLWPYFMRHINKTKIVVIGTHDVDVDRIKILSKDDIKHFENGEEVEKVPKEYGKYIFEIYYNDKYIYEIDTYRGNWHDDTEYIFTFHMDREKLTVELNAKNNGGCGPWDCKGKVKNVEALGGINCQNL